MSSQVILLMTSSPSFPISGIDGLNKIGSETKNLLSPDILIVTIRRCEFKNYADAFNPENKT